MQEGSFVVLVQRQSSVSSWLPFRRLGSDASFTQRFDALSQRAQRACESKNAHAGVPSTPLSFVFPGAFGLALQETQEVAGGVIYRKQPSCFATKRAAIVFQGYLSNLDELIEELLYGALPEPGTSVDSEGAAPAFCLTGRGDQALLAAEVVLHMFLRKRHDGFSLPILLSELQGQFSFVLYDSTKRQVFAARDSSGKEPLFVRHETDNTLAFTNEPGEAWGAQEGVWQEVAPGHYLGGRNPRQAQQYALTPHQLHLRERVESLEEMSPAASPSQPALIDAAAGRAKDGRRSPSSARSSTEMDKRVEELFRISV